MKHPGSIRKPEMADSALLEAVKEMAAGLIDADGGGVVKRRIGLAGRGKRGGARKGLEAVL